MTKLRIAYWATTAVVVGLIGCSCRIIIETAESDKLNAVGGVETYRSQRVANLKALKDKIDIADPDVRKREIERIDRQIDEIENEVTDELGDEVRRVK